jgi:type I restriction enzyme R subunit
VVVNPTLSLQQLFDEFVSVEEPAHREAVREQLVVKLRRRLKRLGDQARAGYETLAGETPEATLKRLEEQPAAESAAWASERPGLGQLLDWEGPGGGSAYRLPISHHPDRVVEVRSGYGVGQRPADYLDSFAAFVRDNLNTIAALTVVVQRPRELTRAELRQLRLELDGLGFSEKSLQRAWWDARNEDIAASIIGFVRQAALGDPLTPFDMRVRAAVQRILARRPWTDVQRKWLRRIEEQIVREVVVDRAALDEEPFKKDGGFTQLNKIFGGQIEQVLADITEQIWEQAA